MSGKHYGPIRDENIEELTPCACIEDPNSFPRRQRIDLMTPAERAIYNTVYEVELLGCDKRLTDAVIKLQEARNLVADYVETYPSGCKKY